MKKRTDREEIDKYKQRPYAGNVIKRGAYVYESEEEIKAAISATETKIKEVLKEMKSIQESISDVIEEQRRLDEVLRINNPQTRVDNDTKQAGREER